MDKLKTKIILLSKINKINYILLNLKESFYFLDEHIKNNNEVPNIYKKVEEFTQKNIEQKTVQEIILSIQKFNIYKEQEKEKQTEIKSKKYSFIISLILNSSEVNITNKNIIISYIEQDKMREQLNNGEIEELRIKALSMKSYMEKDKNKDILMDSNYLNLKNFVDLIQNFKILNIYLKDLTDLGLPEPENLIINIKIIQKNKNKQSHNDNDIENNFDIDCQMIGKNFTLNN